MKLHECKFGMMVIGRESGKVGFITGLTYNIGIEFTGNMDGNELLAHTVPLVKWANGTESGIHHSNIFPFKGKMVS